MTKIHETADNVRRDKLMAQAQEAKNQADNQFTLGYHTLIIGGLAHMVRDAQKAMVEVPQNRLWKLLGKKNSLIPNILKWSGYGLGAMSLVAAYIHKQEQKKAQKELADIEPERPNIPKTDSRTELPQNSASIQDNPSHNSSLHQANTIIDGKTAKIEHLQSSQPDSTILDR